MRCLLRRFLSNNSHSRTYLGNLSGKSFEYNNVIFDYLFLEQTIVHSTIFSYQSLQCYRLNFITVRILCIHARYIRLASYATGFSIQRKSSHT